MNFRRQAQPTSLGFQIAPLIDVLLVLLLYFILTWNFALTETQLDITVPTATEGREAPRAIGQLIINIGPEGQILINRAEKSPAELKEILARLAENYPDQAVVLRGDQSADYRHIVQVLDVCRAANIWNVAFATAKEAPVQ